MNNGIKFGLSNIQISTDNGKTYKIEKYTDKYRSLYQAIMIDLYKDKELNGKESFIARQQINPNLKILLSKEYYDANMKLIKKENIINDNWYFGE